MKLKLRINLQDGQGDRFMYTNLFVLEEWERTESRKLSDGRGVGVSDLACWAHALCKIAGDPVPATWQDWLKQHPDVDIEAIDETNPNPTDRATSATS